MFTMDLISPNKYGWDYTHSAVVNVQSRKIALYW